MATRFWLLLLQTPTQVFDSKNVSTLFWIRPSDPLSVRALYLRTYLGICREGLFGICPLRSAGPFVQFLVFYAVGLPVAVWCPSRYSWKRYFGRSAWCLRSRTAVRVTSLLPRSVCWSCTPDLAKRRVCKRTSVWRTQNI